LRRNSRRPCIWMYPQIGDSRVAFDSFDLGKGSIGEKDYICLRNVVILVRSWVKAAQA
jgi:chemotaxis methyl-accepting protein methylase